jgi:hypothetical protein
MDTDELVIIDAGLSMSFEGLPLEPPAASLPTRAQDVAGNVSRHPSPSASDADVHENLSHLGCDSQNTVPMPHRRLVPTLLSAENVASHDFDRGLDTFLSRTAQDRPSQHHPGPIRVQSVSDISNRQKDPAMNSSRCYPHFAHPVSKCIVLSV